MIRVFTSATQSFGEMGEQAAASWLLEHGYTIVERNVATKYGEIDIVATKGGVHYFFEVKAGKSGGWLNPAENLSPAKLRKCLISAEHYALVHGIKEYRVQGIVVLLDRTGVVKSTELFDLQ